MKQVAQVIGSILYSFLFSALMYVLMVWPLVWIIGLSPFWMFVVLFLFAGIIQGIITLIQVYATLPYAWLLKRNLLATILSIGILVVLIIRSIVFVWKTCVGNGFGMILFAIVASVLLIEVVLGTIPNMLKCYNEEISN